MTYVQGLGLCIIFLVLQQELASLVCRGCSTSLFVLRWNALSWKDATAFPSKSIGSCYAWRPAGTYTQVWTYHGRVAFVLSVTEKGQPIADSVKLQRLRQILFSLMDHHGEGIVNIKRVRRNISCWLCG